MISFLGKKTFFTSNVFLQAGWPEIFAEVEMISLPTLSRRSIRTLYFGIRIATVSFCVGTIIVVKDFESLLILSFNLWSISSLLNACSMLWKRRLNFFFFISTFDLVKFFN